MHLLRAALFTVLLLLIAGLAPAGCATRAAPVVVSADEAIQLVNTGRDVRIVDARKAEDFQKSRLAGSANLPDLTPWYDRLKDPATGFGDPASWEADFQQLRIGPGSRVLIIDSGNAERPGRSASVWYFIQRLGFANASIVDGGFPAIERAATAAPGTVPLTAGPQPDGEIRPLNGPAYLPTGLAARAWTRRKEEVRAALAEPQVHLVDARTSAEYTGQEVYEGNPRGGHIPRAILISNREMYGPDGRFRSPGEIRARLAAAGLKPGDEIITYCQGGGRSASLATAMLYAGYGDVANYFGSFGEWSKDAACPVDTSTP